MRNSSPVGFFSSLGEIVRWRRAFPGGTGIQNETCFDVKEAGVIVSETAPWRFGDGTELEFPAGTVIPAYGRLVIAADPAAFAARHESVPGDVAVPGPFAGDTALSNGDERLELVKPGDQEYGGSRCWIRADWVNYEDAAPRPVSADGLGHRLQLIGPDSVGSNYGNDVANWTAGPPTPGRRGL